MRQKSNNWILRVNLKKKFDKSKKKEKKKWRKLESERKRSKIKRNRLRIYNCHKIYFIIIVLNLYSKIDIFSCAATIFGFIWFSTSSKKVLYVNRFYFNSLFDTRNDTNLRTLCRRQTVFYFVQIWRYFLWKFACFSFFNENWYFMHVIF